MDVTDWQRIRADVVHLFHCDNYFNEQTNSCLQSIKSFDSLNIWRVALGIRFVRWGLWLTGGVWGPSGAADSMENHKLPIIGDPVVLDTKGSGVENISATKMASSWEHSSVLHILSEFFSASLGFLSSEPHSLNNLEKMTTFLASCFLMCEMRIPSTHSALSQWHNSLWKAFWSPEGKVIYSNIDLYLILCHPQV